MHAGNTDSCLVSRMTCWRRHLYISFEVLSNSLPHVRSWKNWTRFLLISLVNNALGALTPRLVDEGGSAEPTRDKNILPVPQEGVQPPPPV